MCQGCHVTAVDTFPFPVGAHPFPCIPAVHVNWSEESSSYAPDVEFHEKSKVGSIHEVLNS